jgi:hypothetical protein
MPDFRRKSSASSNKGKAYRRRQRTRAAKIVGGHPRRSVALWCAVKFGKSCLNSFLVTVLFNFNKWARQVWKIARVEDLHARVMLSVKGSHGSRAARLHGVQRRVEPETEVVSVNG